MSVGVFDLVEVLSSHQFAESYVGCVRRTLLAPGSLVWAPVPLDQRLVREVLPGRYPDSAPIANMTLKEAGRLLGWGS